MAKKKAKIKANMMEERSLSTSKKSNIMFKIKNRDGVYMLEQGKVFN